jgi:hypothetical protein
MKESNIDHSEKKLEEPGVFNDDAAGSDIDIRRKTLLNEAVIAQAGKDILRGPKSTAIEAAYFLFSGFEKHPDEIKQPQSFEKFSQRARLDAGNFAELVWQRLPQERKDMIIKGLKEEYGLDLPSKYL